MRAFLAGFALTVLAIVGLSPTPIERPPPRSPDQLAYQQQAVPTLKPVVTHGAAIADTTAPCRAAFDSLIADNKLVFDHRSEQLRADLMYLLDAGVDALAWCPGTMVNINVSHGTQASASAISLAKRRAAFLAERWANKGLTTQLTESRRAGSPDTITESRIELQAVMAQQ